MGAAFDLVDMILSTQVIILDDYFNSNFSHRLGKNFKDEELF